MHSLIACEVLPENPWVKEKMLAKTWGVRPGLRSDNGAAHRRSRLAGIRLAQPVPALPGHALTGSSTGRRHLSAASSRVANSTPGPSLGSITPGRTRISGKREGEREVVTPLQEPVDRRTPSSNNPQRTAIQ